MQNKGTWTFKIAGYFSGRSTSRNCAGDVRCRWDTEVGGTVLSNQFLSLSTRLPSRYVYGFGENVHKTFRHDLNYTTWGMFARDQMVAHGVSRTRTHYYNNNCSNENERALVERIPLAKSNPAALCSRKSTWKNFFGTWVPCPIGSL